MTIDDVIIRGAIAVNVQEVGRYGADRFVVEVPLGVAPLSDANYYGSLGVAGIIIEIAQTSTGFVTLLTGQIDNVRMDFLDRVVQLCGRDLSARLIDSEISETFMNETSSQIVERIALRHGLTPNVTPTSTPVGQYYELDHARSILGINSRTANEWDLLTKLAQLENFDLSVAGIILNFNPATAGSLIMLNVRDCIGISIDAAKTLPTATTVKSWNTRQKRALTQDSGTKDRRGTTLIKPNLTTEQALELATYHRRCLMQHSLILDAKIPGEFNMVPASSVLLIGTSAMLDQVYVVDSVVREVTMHGGFVQTLRAHAKTS